MQFINFKGIHSPNFPKRQPVPVDEILNTEEILEPFEDFLWQLEDHWTPERPPTMEWQ